jgi:hypothetical protein
MENGAARVAPFAFRGGYHFFREAITLIFFGELHSPQNDHFCDYSEKFVELRV